MATSAGENDLDVIVIGAGISGINAGYRLMTQCPSKRFTILENRFDMGGTWDLFKYPGIRSDSDLHTFGFPWRPWPEKYAIASGGLIKSYLRDSASIHGIDKKIRYGHKLVRGNWSSEQQKWQLSVEVRDEHSTETQTKTFYTRFLVLGTGYYNYEEPLESEINGLRNFKGTTVHPQFWPEELDYSGKRVVVIGSGATAITLLPVLAEQAKMVTMLQRSPSYILALPQDDPIGRFLHWILPSSIATKLVRLKWILMAFFFFQLCRAFPNLSKKVLKKRTTDLLPKNMPFSPNFEPTYNPWDQRVCLCPDGDFFKSLHGGHADIATGHIDTVTEKGITLKSGQKLEADIIVTATGLKLRAGGGAKLSVDGVPYNFGENLVWRGILLQNLPNVAMIMGYTNASWTLGADAAANHICRLLNSMDANGQTSAVPTLADPSSVKPMSALNLKSTYIIRAEGTLPRSGDKAPWQARRNYFFDLWVSTRSSLTDGIKYYSVSS